MTDTASKIETLEDRIRGLLPAALCGLSSQAPLREHGLDSMGLITLIDALEIVFDIEFLDEDLQDRNFQNIDAIRGLIQTRRGGDA